MQYRSTRHLMSNYSFTKPVIFIGVTKPTSMREATGSRLFSAGPRKSPPDQPPPQSSVRSPFSPLQRTSMAQKCRRTKAKTASPFSAFSGIPTPNPREVPSSPNQSMEASRCAMESGNSRSVQDREDGAILALGGSTCLSCLRCNSSISRAIQASRRTSPRNFRNASKR